KILRKLDELASQSSVVKSDHFKKYNNACSLSVKLGEFTHEIKNRLALYIKGRREGSKTDTVHQTIYNVTDSHLSIDETSMWDGCRKLLNGLLQDITTLANDILDPDVIVKVTKPEKVWIIRAQELKAEVIVNVDAEQKAQSLQDQMLRLVKEAKLKDQSLQESNVKVELLEKRIDTFKKQAEQITTLDREAEKSRNQERIYDETIREHQNEITALQEQNMQLRRMIKKPDSKNVPTPVKRPPNTSALGQNTTMHDPENSGSIYLDNVETGSNRELLIQIESLRSALRFLRSENASLRTRAAMHDLDLPADMSTLSTLLIRTSEDDEPSLMSEAGRLEVQKRQLNANSELKAVALETKRLLKDAWIICASPKVVDLTKCTQSKEDPAATTTASEPTTSEPTTSETTITSKRRPWLAQQKRPEWEYHTQQAALHTIHQRSNELKERLAKFSRTIPSAPMRLKKLSLVDVPIARVHLPVGMSDLVGTPDSQQALTKKDLSVFLRSSAEFEAMHQMFVR
ncbi:hypothetical protein BGZ65_009101, partial [Modicella reniformis]